MRFSEQEIDLSACGRRIQASKLTMTEKEQLFRLLARATE